MAASCGLRHVARSFGEFEVLSGRTGLGMECSGNEKATLDLADAIRKGGHLFLVGVPWLRGSETTAHELLLKIFYGYLTVYSGWEWSLPNRSEEFRPLSHRLSLEKGLDWIRKSSIGVEGIYGLYEPQRCHEVYTMIADRKHEKTCAIFDWRMMG